MYDYRGCLHVHSTYSDGHGDVPKIMAAANEAGLDFVVLTDHDTTAPAKDGHEKWHDSALLIAGIEITPPVNHYVVFGDGKLPDAETLKMLPPQEVVAKVNEAGWLGFIAHPDHQGTKRFEIPSYAWQDWSVDGFTGISLWDLMTDFQSKLDGETVDFDLYDNFAKHLSGPRPETLARFDQLAARRKVVAVGEVDNHDKPYKVGEREVRVFPYDWAFRSVVNHVLLEKPLDRDYAKAKSQVVDAFRAGRTYVSLDWFADPAEFAFEAEELDRTALMGDTLKIEEVAKAIVTLPEPGTIRVVHNGVVVSGTEGDEAIVELEEPGVVRVEVLREGRPWIYSNPIYLTK